MNAHAVYFLSFLDYLIDFISIYVSFSCPYAIELECDALKSFHFELYQHFHWQLFNEL